MPRPGPVLDHPVSDLVQWGRVFSLFSVAIMLALSDLVGIPGPDDAPDVAGTKDKVGNPHKQEETAECTAAFIRVAASNEDGPATKED